MSKKIPDSEKCKSRSISFHPDLWNELEKKFQKEKAYFKNMSTYLIHLIRNGMKNEQ